MACVLRQTKPIYFHASYVFQTRSACIKARTEARPHEMSDVYKDVMAQVFTSAPEDMVAGFKRKMLFIQSNCPHSKRTVESCLEGLSTKPTLVELMAAAYLVNGGLVFKHEESQESDTEDIDYARLLKEMDDLHCAGTEAKPVAASPTLDVDIFGEIE
jgi:hypothetical protein